MNARIFQGAQAVAKVDRVSIQDFRTKKGRYISFWTTDHLKEGTRYSAVLEGSSDRIDFVVASAPESVGAVRVTGLIEESGSAK